MKGQHSFFHFHNNTSRLIMDLSTIEILMVEDNPHDAELALRALNKNKLSNKVLHVKDGAEALDIIFPNGTDGRHNGEPRMILLDLKLPKVDGLEVLKRLKSNERTK